MPKPNNGETRKEYISRCIPIVIDEGTAEKPDQAAAICHSMWEKAQEGKSAAWVTVDEMRELCPSCADSMVKHGFSRININELGLEFSLKAQGNIEGLATHLAHSYGDDPGYWTKCDQSDELADYDEETRAAICARAHYIWVGKWPGEKSIKQISLDERLIKIRVALEHQFTPPAMPVPATSSYYWVEYVYDDYAILNNAGSRYRVDFQLNPEGDVISVGTLTEVKPEWKPVKGFWYAGSSDGDALKLGARNNRSDRERVRKIRRAAKDIHDTTMEMESRDADDETDEPEMMESVARMMGSMGKNAEMLIACGGAVKAIDLGNGTTEVGGYLVTFGDETTPDLSPQRDYFDKRTDFRFTFPGKSATYFNHTLPVATGDRQFAVSKPLKNASELTLDDIGVFAKAILDERDEYEKFLIELANQGILNWSSGTAEHLVRRTPAKNGTNHIDVWPLGLDASLTHAPADWRNQVLPLKSLAGQGVIQLHAEQAQPEGAPEAVGNTAASDGQASEAAIKSTNPQKGAIEMELTPELQTLVADVAKTAAAEAAKSAASEAVKAYQLATEKPVNDPGTLLPGTVAGISGDGQPADRPYKSIKAGGFAQFLSDVAFAARPGVAPDGKLQAIQSAGVKALGANEAIPSEGGWLVQTDHAAELYKLTFDSGVLSSRCNRKQITTNANGMTLNALEESSRATGSRFGGVRGYRLAEGGTITSGKPAFRQMELKLKKFAALVYATDELLQDSGLLEQVVMEAAPAELAFMVDDDIMNGLGVAGPFGILNSPALVSVSAETGQAATTLVFENVVKMWARRWSRSSANYIWYTNQDIEPQFYSMSLAVGTGGVPVYMPPGGISGQPYGTLFGRPVIPTEFNASLGTAGDIVLADLTQYQLIDKGGVQGSSSMHVAFITDEMVYRFIYRVDGQPLWASALTPYKGTGNTQSPFIALAARA